VAIVPSLLLKQHSSDLH